MTRARCTCGRPAIGVIVVTGDSVLVCQECYRAACLAMGGDLECRRVTDSPRRWPVRRTPTGSWAVHLHLRLGVRGGVYAPMGTWPTWADALAWIERVAEANYERTAA